MLKILRGREVTSFKEAAALAFRESGVGDMSVGVAELFATAVDENKLLGKATKNIEQFVRSKYREKPTWDQESWYVPIPLLQYDSRGIPRLTIEIKVHLVATVDVTTTSRYYFIVLAGTIGESQTLSLPMVFLHAILSHDVRRFQVLARSPSHTTWEIPSGAPVELPNEFLDKLCQALERQSVARWLGNFGSQGKSMRPLVVGSLVGLQFMGKASPLPAGQQRWSRELVISALKPLGYGTKEAEEMFNRVAPALRAEYCFEEVIRLVLRQGATEANNG